MKLVKAENLGKVFTWEPKWCSSPVSVVEVLLHKVLVSRQTCWVKQHVGRKGNKTEFTPG